MEKLTVIKVGGKIVEEEATLYKLLDDFAAIEGYKVLVHGGGRSATKLAAQLGIESKMVNGRRITDAETLKVVTMVYGGLVNKNIVAGLQARGVNALGLTGADMDVIRSVKRPVKEVDYGFVGDVRGEGMLLAFEIVSNRETREPLPPGLKAFDDLVERAYAEGLIIYSRRSRGGYSGDHFLICPPMITTEAQVDEIMEKLDRALEGFSAAHAGLLP